MTHAGTDEFSLKLALAQNSASPNSNFQREENFY